MFGVKNKPPLYLYLLILFFYVIKFFLIVNHKVEGCQITNSQTHL